MECQKCNHYFKDSCWESKKTYHGIDEHHNPPRFLSKKLKEKWIGETYNLCRKCHRKLHDEILKILNENSNNFKFIKSEYWTLKKMNIKQIKKAKEEIYAFTKRWIKEDDTKTTP